jgi:hypothetical protein
MDLCQGVVLQLDPVMTLTSIEILTDSAETYAIDKTRLFAPLETSRLLDSTRHPIDTQSNQRYFARHEQKVNMGRYHEAGAWEMVAHSRRWTCIRQLVSRCTSMRGHRRSCDWWMLFRGARISISMAIPQLLSVPGLMRTCRTARSLRYDYSLPAFM